eukprot:3666351-Rhodomonas_salina.1
MSHSAEAEVVGIWKEGGEGRGRRGSRKALGRREARRKRQVEDLGSGSKQEHAGVERGRKVEEGPLAGGRRRRSLREGAMCMRVQSSLVDTLLVHWVVVLAMVVVVEEVVVVVSTIWAVMGGRG